MKKKDYIIKASPTGIGLFGLLKLLHPEQTIYAFNQQLTTLTSELGDSKPWLSVLFNRMNFEDW